MAESIAQMLAAQRAGQLGTQTAGGTARAAATKPVPQVAIRAVGDTLRDAENDHSPGAATGGEVSLPRARMARKRDLPSVRPMPICE